MNTPFQLDSRCVRRWFDRASTGYAAAAGLQAQVRDELLSRLDFFQPAPQLAIDLGAGLGEGAVRLRQRYPRARVIAVDLAPAMLRQGARRRFWRRPLALCADVRRLPFADGSVDLAFSNLMLQWCDQPGDAFTEIARVLKPGGLLLASTFGPLTLQELRDAWAAVDHAPHVSRFPDLPELGTALATSGFQEPVLDIEQSVRHYPDALSLQRELQNLGARNADRARRRTLTGKSRWRAMSARYESLRSGDGLPATWELIYMAAFASGRRGARPAGSGEHPGEHGVPVASIKVRKPPVKGFFVTGTDTGVGKTRVTAGLIAAFRDRGLPILGMKPVSCGLFNDNGRYLSEDVDIICRYSGQDPYGREVNPYALRDPVSPHIAAEKAGICIDVQEIGRVFADLSGRAPLVVEGAGGWEVPISDSQTMADVAVALGLPVLLVVGLRLGCLNHALLTARAITASGLPFAGWIGNRIDETFAEPEANLATLATRLGKAPLAVLPYSHSLRSALPALDAAAAALLRAWQADNGGPAAEGRLTL